MNIQVIIVQFIQLFIYILVGWVLGIRNIFNQIFIDDLPQFILKVTMPCMIVASVMNSEKNIQLPIQDLFWASLILLVVLPFISWIVVKILRIKKSEKGLYMFMMLYPNVGFMGFPIMLALFGQVAILDTAIINMGFNLSLFTLGIVVMNCGNDNKVQFKLENIISPGVISSLLAIFIYSISIEVPEVIFNPLHSIGSMTTPLAMIVIGFSLSQYKLKDIFGDKVTYGWVFIINIIIPLLLYPFINLFVADDMIKGICLIILAMPVANSAILFSKTYNKDEMLATRIICVSTLLSIITIPFLISLVLI